MTSKFLITFIFVIIYKSISNFFALKKIKQYNQEYIDFLRSNSDIIIEHSKDAIDLLKRAGIQDLNAPITQPVGYNTIAKFTTSIFTTFPTQHQVFAPETLIMFQRAVGVYKSRIIQTFNPIYWIDCVIFLPKNLLVYLGANEEKFSNKLLNILMTSLWWMICFITIFFQNEIKQLIIQILG